MTQTVPPDPAMFAFVPTTVLVATAHVISAPPKVLELPTAYCLTMMSGSLAACAAADNPQLWVMVMVVSVSVNPASTLMRLTCAACSAVGATALPPVKGVPNCGVGLSAAKLE